MFHHSWTCLRFRLEAHLGQETTSEKWWHRKSHLLRICERSRFRARKLVGMTLNGNAMPCPLLRQSDGPVFFGSRWAILVPDTQVSLAHVCAGDLFFSVVGRRFWPESGIETNLCSKKWNTLGTAMMRRSSQRLIPPCGYAQTSLTCRLSPVVSENTTSTARVSVSCKAMATEFRPGYMSVSES